MIILFIIILSAYFTIIHFGKSDLILENEKIEFAKFAVNNLHGKTLRDVGPAMDYIFYYIMTDSTGEFKKYKINSDIKQYQRLTAENDPFDTVFIYGESLQDIIINGKDYGLRYIISDENGQFFYPFLDDLYYNEANYPYLIKVFDSDKVGFEKLKIKVFEIDYKKFQDTVS
jgi:hypothetical protein